MPYLCMKPALNNKEFFLDLITIFKLIKLEFPFWLLAEYSLETCNSQMADNKGAKASCYVNILTYVKVGNN